MSNMRGNQSYPDIGVEPCAGCRFKDACASAQMACPRFERYTATGVIQLTMPIVPTHKLWLQLFGGDPRGSDGNY